MTDTASDRKSPSTSTDTSTDTAVGLSLLVSAPPTADLVPPYAELGMIVLGEQPLGAVLQRIAELAKRIVPGADEVSVTLMKHGHACSVAFTGDLAVDLDERQYADGFGPCVDAAISGKVITVEDTANSETYPDFGYQAQRHGIHHTLSVGMPTSHSICGAINLYSTDSTAGPFSRVAHDVATTFATYAAITLLNAATHAAALDEVVQMRQAMTSRAGIEQAKGMLVRERRCSAARSLQHPQVAVLTFEPETTRRRPGRPRRGHLTGWGPHEYLTAPSGPAWLRGPCRLLHLIARTN